MSDEELTPKEDAAVPATTADLALEDAVDEVLRIKLDQFEGPFEVLLYLIRSQEIDIFDIPMLKITEQYLGFLDMMHHENLDIAGEFLVMAATLIHIKSKMILPMEVDDEDDEEIEEEDPRLELVEKLLEYRQYRGLSLVVGALWDAHKDSYGRLVKPIHEAEEDEEYYFEVSLYDLTQAIRAILRFVTAPPIHEVTGDASSVDEKIGEIEQLLEERDSVTWTDLFRDARTKAEIICYLLAILELCRMRRIRAHQHSAFGEIRLFAQAPDPEPAAAPE